MDVKTHIQIDFDESAWSLRIQCGPNGATAFYLHWNDKTNPTHTTVLEGPDTQRLIEYLGAKS